MSESNAIQLDRAPLEKQLEALHGQIRMNRIEAGRIISDLRKTFKHGGWVEYSEGLYNRLGISMKSAYRYVEAFEQSQTLGEPICVAAEKANVNLNKSSARQKLIQMKSKHPDKTAEEIVHLTNLALSQPRSTGIKPQAERFNGSDFIATVTKLRAEMSKLNQFTKEVERGGVEPAESESVIKCLRDLEKDANDRATRLADALNSAQVAA